MNARRPHASVAALVLLLAVPWTAVAARAAFPLALAQAPGGRPPASAPADAGTDAQGEPRDVVADHQDVTVARGEKVGDLVVAMGDARVEGEVTGHLVVILGTARVSGTVSGNAVAVGGRIVLEDGAHVRGGLVALGGILQRSGAARVDGKLFHNGMESIPEPWRRRGRLFLEECLLLARPLSPRVDFVWWGWLGLLGAEAILALLFPGAVRSIVRTCRERPLGSALMGLAGIPLLLLVMATLTITLVLAPAVPLVIVAALLAVGLGQASFLRLLGAAVLPGARPAALRPALEFVLGALLLTGLFLVPFVGIVAWASIHLWVFGATLLALFPRRRATVAPPVSGPPAMPDGPGASIPRVMPDAAGVTPGGPPVAPAATLPPLHPLQPASIAMITEAMPTQAPPENTPGATPTPTPDVPAGAAPWFKPKPGPALSQAQLAAAAYPGIWRRTAALLLDWVPLLILASPLPSGQGVVGIAYFAAMVAWRGTTLGGMITGLRVVRLDGRPIDRPTAVVRALAAVLSVLSLGLGWLWACWDDRRQTWHDRLAGTVVVRDDSGRSLV